MTNPVFPVILTFPYWEVIRPRFSINIKYLRGELLLRKSIKFNWNEVLPLTNEEFLKKYEIPLEVKEEISI
jgi:hypothetical protein